MTTLIKNGTVVSATGRHDVDVLVDGETIAALLQPGSDPAASAASGAETVIDATGSLVSMSNAFQYCAFTGQVVYVGITTDEVKFRHVVIHRPEITIKASRNAVPGDFSRIIRLIEEGVIDTDPWLSHHASYDDFIAEFSNWIKPETGIIKAVLHMN